MGGRARGLGERLLIFISRRTRRGARRGATKFRRGKLEEKREARSVSLAGTGWKVRRGVMNDSNDRAIE